MPPVTRVALTDTCRLIPSRYPPAGILDMVASPHDLDLIFELESWTNDRISEELGILRRLPPEEWVVGRPMASVIMAAFCHPRPTGGRFNGPDRGAWYAGLTLDSAHGESIFHRTAELTEIGVLDARVEMRLYLADFNTAFHDIRGRSAAYKPYHDPVSYAASQALARELFDAGSAGILYRSVRHTGGECLACFRPALVGNVRPAAHFAYVWEGKPTPRIERLRDTK
jgi:hypothetical protein